MLWREKSYWREWVLCLISLACLLAYIYSQSGAVAQQATTKPATQPATQPGTQALWPAALQPTPPEDGNWTMPAKNFANTRYSGLDQINTENVSKLQVAWTFSTGLSKGHEAAPIIVNNTMYVVTPYPNILYALDLTKNGELKWKYESNPNPSSQGTACCDVVNRGAMYDNGTIYFNSLDAFTHAVDANTGQKKWKTQLGEVTRGETITMAPVVKDPFIVERLTPLIVPFSHVQHKESTDPDQRMTDPIIGLETGSSRLFDIFMKGKAYPYKAGQWRDVVLKGMETLNKHNWFPFCTFIIGLPGETDADTKESLNLLYDLRDAKGTFVPTFFVPLENTRMQKKDSAKLIEMTDLQWEFFYTCWKYNLHFWHGGTSANMKFSLGVPLYYYGLGRKLFGNGIKYPLYRFAGVPDRFMRKHLYLDFTGYKRSKGVMHAPVDEILPGFKTVRDHGLNMIDATQLHRIGSSMAATAEPIQIAS